MFSASTSLKTLASCKQCWVSPLWISSISPVSFYRYPLLRLLTNSELLAKCLNYYSPTDSKNCAFTMRSNTNYLTDSENFWFAMSDTILFSEFLVPPWGVIGVAHRNFPINMLIFSITANAKSGLNLFDWNWIIYFKHSILHVVYPFFVNVCQKSNKTFLGKF